MKASNVSVCDHPLVQHHLTVLRHRDSTPDQFRQALRRLSVLLAYEATRDLPLAPVRVPTPLARAACGRVRARVGLIPILRAGLGMVDPILDLIPGAEVRHLGFYRDEKTLQPVEYYRKFPAQAPVDVALILDPMLATGGSAVAALRAVREWGVKNCQLLAIIAAPEGIARVRAEFPRTRICVCAVDQRLNRRAYIVPGLGDAGDRQFNTV